MISIFDVIKFEVLSFCQIDVLTIYVSGNLNWRKLLGPQFNIIRKICIPITDILRIVDAEVYTFSSGIPIYSFIVSNVFTHICRNGRSVLCRFVIIFSIFDVIKFEVLSFCQIDVLTVNFSVNPR